ncbi:hypothetical protein A3J23_00660 [Candidatus Peregrinibacteria bacterium RIFCSPLOWO2_02_FULL_48_14]|nr:MAG: hypothetical protein A3J23_00660 [Candidatus Peregrinibacteria bacterium RIFCSPLOWO2_02_FULL_48_14]
MLNRIFSGEKPIMGMVHVDDLYGPKGLDVIAHKALTDARNLHLDGAGVDGLIIENWEEKSDRPFVVEETVRRLLQITQLIRDQIKAPIGINVLHNDYRSAFAIAQKLGLPFVQLDVCVDKVETEFEYTQGVQFKLDVDLQDVNKVRQGVNAALFSGVHPKHYKLLEEGKTIEESTRQAIYNNVDAVVVTRLTGTAPAVELVKRVKDFAEGHKKGFPVIVGSGVNIDNLGQLLEHGDGAIVGTTLKVDQVTDNLVDPRRVEQFMNAVRKIFRQ